MAEQVTYRANLEIDGDRWLVTSPDVPGAISHGRSVEGAIANIKEAIALMEDLVEGAEATMAIQATFELHDKVLNDAVTSALKSRRVLEEAQKSAQRALAETVKLAEQARLSLRDLAQLTGVSFQRIAQVRSQMASALEAETVALSYSIMKGTSVSSKRDTTKYDFLDTKGRIIHSGITNDLDRREGELRRQYNQSGHIKQVGRKTTREGAQEWEKGKKKA